MFSGLRRSKETKSCKYYCDFAYGLAKTDKSETKTSDCEFNVTDK